MRTSLHFLTHNTTSLHTVTTLVHTLYECIYENVSKFLSTYEALLYNVTTQITTLYKCIYKSVSMSVGMQQTSLQYVSLSP